MGLRVATNISSVNAQRSLAGSQREIQKSYAQLSSGSRITKSSDDAAGLSISENLKATVRSYAQAQRNSNDGMSMVQVAEGGLSEISNILTRLRELGVQASSDTVGESERGFINKEVQQLLKESQRISQTTKWGSQSLLDGTGQTFEFQIGMNNNDFEDRIAYDASEQNASNENIGIDGFDFSNKEGAREALERLDVAQRTVNGFRANLGAIQNRLTSTTDNLGVAMENFTAANSRIRDTDIAQSSAELARNSVLLNASVGVLAQANQTPNMALRLLNS